MIPSMDELEEIEVVADRITKGGDKWLVYFRLFKNDLFGSSENSNHCVIVNPEGIDFSFQEDENKLTAFASEPLKIRNEAMAYQITY